MSVLRFILSLALAIAAAGHTAVSAAAPPPCTPTEPDMLGPFYKPNAPVRSKVGEGYVLSGVARSAATCTPIKGAQIEFWLAGPDGDYDDRYRARMFTDAAGTYRFESPFPEPYGGRPPHIHIRVSAEGYRPLVTQHYPVEHQKQGKMDLVLIPER